MSDARTLGVASFPKNYRRVGCLGRNGTAVAFEVVHLPTGEHRVAKPLPEAALVDPTLVQRMQHEARLLRRLRHPNIVRVLDWGHVEGGRPFLVLEYLEGVTVAEEVRRRTLAVSEAVTWTSQILCALGAAHAAGLVHRDVSPENLMLCAAPGGRIIKVCDFGFAKVVDEQRAAVPTQHEAEDHSILGSPYYASPEAVRAEPLDARADLYQVGLVLYTMLTGYIPFSEMDDTVAVLGARLCTELPPAAELRGATIPGGLEGILRKALAPTPADRFETAQEFAGALAELSPPVQHHTATLRNSGPVEEWFWNEEECPSSPGRLKRGLSDREASDRELSAHGGSGLGGVELGLSARGGSELVGVERGVMGRASQGSVVDAAVARWLAGIEGGSKPAR